MLRDRINDALKPAMRAKEARRVATLRLIMAAIKDREIAARSEQSGSNLDDVEVTGILQKMVKQRRESIGHFESGGRLELAEQEQEEIDIIQEFLPRQLDAAAMEAAARTIITEIDAGGIKDMGRIMNTLKERYQGQMDPSAAGAIVRRILCS